MEKLDKQNYSQQTTAESGSGNKCQICAQKAAEFPAEYRCVPCDRRLCQRCRDHHSAVPACSDHTFQFIGSERAPATKCCNHEIVATYFCRKCLVPLCVDCMMGDEHRPHPGHIDELGEAVRSQKVEMANLFEQMGDYVSKVAVAIYRAEHMSDMEATENMIRYHVETAKRRVDMESKALVLQLREACPDCSLPDLQYADVQARELLKDIEHILGSSDKRFLTETKVLKPRAQAFLASFAHLSTNSGNTLTFLRSKELSPGCLVGTLEPDGAVGRQGWEPPCPPPQPATPVIPPRST